MEVEEVVAEEGAAEGAEEKEEQGPHNHNNLCPLLRANAPCSVSGLLTDYYTAAPSHCLSYPQLGGLMPRE